MPNCCNDAGASSANAGAEASDRASANTTSISFATETSLTSFRRKPDRVCRIANANTEGGAQGERHGWPRVIHFGKPTTATWIPAFAKEKAALRAG
jgi:hypothetical protein